MEVIVGATRPAGKDARLTTKGRPYGLLKIWIRIPQSFPQFVPHQRSGYFFDTVSRKARRTVNTGVDSAWAQKNSKPQKSL